MSLPHVEFLCAEIRKYEPKEGDIIVINFLMLEDENLVFDADSMEPVKEKFKEHGVTLIVIQGQMEMSLIRKEGM